MFFYSTRNRNLHQTLSQAMLQGLAPDGGLFVPQEFPQINYTQLNPNLTYAQFAAIILAAYFYKDKLEPNLSPLCNSAFNFPLPLKQLNHNTYVLELFHGPTLSFKDFGARFLAECMRYLEQKQKTTILVATSGDTGSAVASAFHHKPKIEVAILFPYGQISPRQQQQISCWDDNILALAVNGSFDDCQQLVKQAFNANNYKINLSSANSINIARLLPQLTYYAYTSWNFYLQHKQAVGFIIPSGNVGNATAAFWAKSMGFPIREIVLATNQNQVISDYLKNGVYAPRPSIPTLANAMDVGNPNNFERLRHLYHNDYLKLKTAVRAFSVSDRQIRETIDNTKQAFNYIVCPHTATACFIRQQLDQQPWVIVATADPCKFDTIIEPIIKQTLPIAPQLQQLLNQPAKIITINPSLNELYTALLARN
jgi:threonine synthase